MLNFNIPGRRNLKIDKIIFDLNGTIACDGSRFKADFVEKLGRKRVIAVGNGNNDAQMLKKSELGITVIGPEGAAKGAILGGEMISRDIKDVFKIISNSGRLKATLRK